MCKPKPKAKQNMNRILYIQYITTGQKSVISVRTRGQEKDSFNQTQRFENNKAKKRSKFNIEYCRQYWCESDCENVYLSTNRD